MNEFDVVVIIRGGGATSDLSGFDTYLLAAACAQFPLPVITGIGHERDDTVLDSVAHTRVKTPTAAAELLIHRITESADHLEELSARLQQGAYALLEQEGRRLEMIQTRIPNLVHRNLQMPALPCWQPEKTWRKPLRPCCPVIVTGWNFCGNVWRMLLPTNC